MKHLFIIVTFIVASLNIAYANEPTTINGRVVDSKGKSISYATVALSLSGEQITGAATDDKGYFLLKIENPEQKKYTLQVSYVGYTTYAKELDSLGDIGNVTLKEDAKSIDKVVVTANYIRREADRFVVDVASSPAAIAKNGEELLKSSPGVWINDDKISINGKSNPKIYVNERELKLSSEQIMVYMRNLKSEDVTKIEVIPQSGADYDADSSSGIIKITLKRQLQAGIMGNVSMHSSNSKYITTLAPSASINFQSNKLTLNTSGWYNSNDTQSSTEGETTYSNIDAKLKTSSENEAQYSMGGGRVEAIYDFNSKHSVGAEANIFSMSNSGPQNAISNMTMGGVEELTKAIYNPSSQNTNISTTFNYIYKIDSLGSVAKFLVDNSYSNSWSDNHNVSTTNAIDSLYNSTSESQFRVTTATLALEKVYSPKFNIKAGLKFTNNDMDSHADYTYLNGDQWIALDKYNREEIYTENIGAGYLVGSSRINRWSFVAGLRSEYTNTSGRGNSVQQSYWSWFPNVNVSYSLDKAGSNSIVAQYSRSIARPNFWFLDPSRQQISEYSYYEGNPSLLPSYSNSVGLTFTYKYKYSLSFSADFTTDNIQQIMRVDSSDKMVVMMLPINIDVQNNYSANLYLPFQITKWWSLSAYGSYTYRGEKFTPEAELEYKDMGYLYSQTTFTLPKNFFIDLNYMGMTAMYSGNIEVAGMSNIGASVKKRFSKNRFTASVGVSNILNNSQEMRSKNEGVEQYSVERGAWNSRRFSFSLSYNFKAGKEYQHRAGVESASPEDAGRLSSNKN